MVSATVPVRARLDRRRATRILWLAAVACLAFAVVQSRLDRVDDLSVVLGVAAVVAGLTVSQAYGRITVSACFLVILLAAALLGPASAAACAAISELTAARKLRTPAVSVGINLLGTVGPALVAANFIRLTVGAPENGADFYLVAAGAGALYLILNFAIVAPLHTFFRGGERSFALRVLWELAPSYGLNIGLAVAGASIYLEVGLGGIVFALTAIFAFSYMAYLLAQSRNRAEQYVSLSWGVLAGLMRTLDIRDQRAARHAAAVARFARDMSKAVGMSEQEQELAHTAGLLHDIGHFALSDRVAERGRTLTEEDWIAIQQHPELGADMLKDLGMYGPVGEIVLAHHERLDGRGYPHGLYGEEIPEIAKIISVAEVYDTLTASDTYRTRMSSFEALRELRRVSGTQLDGRYVEVLAGLLTGEGVEYRHADAADFDTELAMERRIKEARTG
jgi:putative nucleotidyltransferase with HDIG domain